MDDGKCLLDVISDPQALKEFFRSSSQIAFVDESISPIIDETSHKSSKSTVQNDDSKIPPNKGMPLTSVEDLNKVTRLSDVYAEEGSNLSKQLSTAQNGLTHSNIKTCSNLSTITQQSGITANATNANLPVATNPNISGVGSTEMIGIGSSIPLSPSYVNAMQTTFSSGKHGSPSAQIVNSQTQPSTLPTFLSSPPANLRPQTSKPKGSPLPILRPKGLSGSAGSQVTIQGGLMTQGLRASAIKGQQQLVAIRPKIVMTQSKIGNQVTPGIMAKQPITSTFTVGTKGPQNLSKQDLSTLSVSQLKQATSSQPANKTVLANLVQSQPRQIAPKPEQISIGNAEINKQGNLQFVQSLLANNQDIKLSAQEILTTQQKAAQQNQLKILLQQNPLVQQALQARAQLQHQSLQQQQQQSQLAKTQQQNIFAFQNKVVQSIDTQANQQSTKQEVAVTLQQSMNTTNLANQLKEAINSKQLNQFLEKNPIVAKQLKQLNIRNKTAPTTVTKLSTSQAPLSVATMTKLNEIQTPKATNQRPSLTIGHLQKPSTVRKSATLTHTQKSNIVTSLNQPGQTTAKTINIASASPMVQVTTGQTTTSQKPEQKAPNTQQKVVILQNDRVSTQSMAAGETKVLLQTKEGRPILITQEQFRQIQAQLASKNLSIQGKLVTASPVVASTSTTARSSVTTSISKSIPKVVSLSSKTPSTKQESKSAKRPSKTVETKETKLAKRIKLSLEKDQNDACFTDVHKAFKSHKDAVTRLTPYHIFSEPSPNAKMQNKANMLLDKLAVQLTNKSDKMVNKYRQLLLKDMQRDVPSAEVVMMNRIFLADEKALLLQEKQSVLEDAKKFAQATKATLNQIKATSNCTNSTTEMPHSQDISKDVLTAVQSPTEIAENDEDSSPATSENNFQNSVAQLNTDDTELINALEPG